MRHLPVNMLVESADIIIADDLVLQIYFVSPDCVATVVGQLPVSGF